MLKVRSWLHGHYRSNRCIGPINGPSDPNDPKRPDGPHRPNGPIFEFQIFRLELSFFRIHDGTKTESLSHILAQCWTQLPLQQGTIRWRSRWWYHQNVSSIRLWKNVFQRLKFFPNFFWNWNVWNIFSRFDFIWDATSKKSDLDYYEKMQKLAEGFMKYEGEYFYEAKVSHQKFIGGFPGHARPIYGKLIQSPISEFWSMTKTDFRKTHPNKDDFPEICLVHVPILI